MLIRLPHNWTPRPYQLNAFNALDSGKKRVISVWHRRAGKDLTAINYCAKASQERVGLYLHLLPFYKQGRKIVWNGIDKSGKRFLSAFPEQIVEGKNDQEMLLRLKNGSMYQVAGTDNIDSLVGTNPVGLILSEYSIQDPRAFDYLRPILAENEGWAWFIYTPRGRNHGYDLLERAKANPKWLAEVLNVNDTHAISEAVIEEDRLMGMPEEMIQQEYYCSFDAPLFGAYYSNQMSEALKAGRIGKHPWDPMVPVHTAWDLGMGDCTAIWFFQEVYNEIRIIDYYENSGEGLLHYFKVLRDRPYNYDEHWAPHDIKVRELSTGRSRLETALEHGVRFRVCPKIPIEDGIEAVRNILPRCYFNYDEQKPVGDMKMGIECLRQYQKEFDEKHRTFKTRPLHDWTSHGADAFRVMAVSRRPQHRNRIKRQEFAVSDYDII